MHASNVSLHLAVVSTGEKCTIVQMLITFRWNSITCLVGKTVERLVKSFNVTTKFSF